MIDKPQLVKVIFRAQKIEQQLLNCNSKEDIIQRATQVLIEQSEKLKAELEMYFKSGRRFLTLEKAEKQKIFEGQQITVEIIFKHKEVELHRKARHCLETISHNFDQLQKLHERIEDNPNRQALLRKLANQAELKHNELEEEIIITILISDPLIKIRNNEKIPIYREEFNVMDYQKLIQDAYKNNYSIKVTLQKSYATKIKLAETLAKEAAGKEHRIVQIYADVYKKDDKIFLCLQKAYQLGEQQLCPASHLLNREVKCDLIIIVGVNVHLLETIDVSAPMILISSYSPDEDEGTQLFFQQFYASMFRREGIERSFQNGKKNFQNDKIIKKKKIFCCCLHDHRQECHWNQIVNVLGLSIAHKVFMHDRMKSHAKPDIERLQKDILNIMKVRITCASEAQMCCNSEEHKNVDNKIIFKDRFQRNQLRRLKSSEDKLSHVSSNSFHGIPNEQLNRRGRPLILYEFVQTILNTDGILQIVGDRMSGKFYFCNLACRYIEARKQDEFHFQTRHIDQNSEQTYQKTIEYLESLSKNSKRNIITYENHSQNPGGLIDCVLKNKERIKNTTVIFLNRGQIIQERHIVLKKLTRLQILHLVIKQFSNGDYLQILPQIISKFSDETDHTITELPFLKLSKFLKNLYSKIEPKTGDRKINIEAEIQNFKFGHRQLIQNVKSTNKSYWMFLNFLSSFKEGVFMNEITLKILRLAGIYQPEDLMTQIRKKTEQNLSLISIQENRQKVIVVLPQQPIRREWKSERYREQSLQLKFFQILMYLARRVASNFQHFRLSTEKWDEGIFMIKLDRKFNVELMNFIQGIAQKAKDNAKELDKLVQHHCSHLLNFLANNKMDSQGAQALLVDSACVFSLLVNKKHSIDRLKTIILAQSRVLWSQNSFFSRVACLEAMTAMCLVPPQLNIAQSHNSSEQMQISILNCLSVYQSRMLFFNQKRNNKQVSENEQDQVQQLKRIQLCITKINRMIEISQIYGEKLPHGLTREKCLALKVKILLERVLLRFLYPKLQDTNYRHCIKADNLYKQLKSICSTDNHVLQMLLKKYRNQIDLCLQYLDLEMRIQDNQLNKLPDANEVRQHFQVIIHWIMEKDDERVLLNRKNTMLFMKSRCLTLKGQPYIFIRRSQLVKEFIFKILEQYELNIGFFILNRNNLDLIKNSKCLLLVLTADCIERFENSKITHKLLFQHNDDIREELIEPQDMITILKKSSIQFLVLCGHNTSKFAKQLTNSFKDHPTIISIDNNIRLSSSNQVDYHENQSLISQIETYEKKQTWNRIGQLMIGSIVKNIIAFSNLPTTAQRLEKIPEQALSSICKIMKAQWPLVEKIKQNMKITTIVSHSLKQLPSFEKGKLHNISSKVFEIPNNLAGTNNDENMSYEVIGKISQIAVAVRHFKNEQSGLVEILGAKRSGKSCLLQELCWYFLNKRVFKQGVYRIKMQKLRRTNTEIIQHLDAKYQYVLSCIQNENKIPFPLLIVLDDLEFEDIKENEHFFMSIRDKPISILYATHDPKVKECLGSLLEKEVLRIKIDQMTKNQMFSLIVSKMMSLTDDYKKIQQIARTLISKNLSAGRFFTELEKELEKHQITRNDREDFIKLLQVEDIRIRMNRLNIQIMNEQLNNQ